MSDITVIEFPQGSPDHGETNPNWVKYAERVRTADGQTIDVVVISTRVDPATEERFVHGWDRWGRKVRIVNLRAGSPFIPEDVPATWSPRDLAAAHEAAEALEAAASSLASVLRQQVDGIDHGGLAAKVLEGAERSLARVKRSLSL